MGFVEHCIGSSRYGRRRKEHYGGDDGGGGDDGVNGMDVKADRWQKMEAMVDMKKEEEGRFRSVGFFS